MKRREPQAPTGLFTERLARRLLALGKRRRLLTEGSLARRRRGRA